MDPRMKSLLTRFFVLAAALAALNCGPRDGADRYPLKGKVESLDILDRELTVAHEEIPGFMAAMTMPFKMPEDKSLLARFRGMRLERLRRGDVITATLVVKANESWIENVSIPFDFIGNYITKLQNGDDLARPMEAIRAERDRIVNEYAELLPSDADREAFQGKLGLARAVFPYVGNHTFHVGHLSLIHL